MEFLEQIQEGNYLITKYKNGTIVKELITEKNEEQAENIIDNNILTQEEFQNRMILDIEYLKCLTEINGGF